MGTELNKEIRSVVTIEGATEADIIVATTPSTKPIVKKQYIRLRIHINAIGADAKEKQKLESDLLAMAKVAVDDIEPASYSG